MSIYHLPFPIMNQDTLLEQEHKRLQIQNSLNVCISLSSQHCGLLIEFLVNQSINFSASSSPSTQ